MKQRAALPLLQRLCNIIQLLIRLSAADSSLREYVVETNARSLPPESVRCSQLHLPGKNSVFFLVASLSDGLNISLYLPLLRMRFLCLHGAGTNSLVNPLPSRGCLRLLLWQHPAPQLLLLAS